MSSPSANGRAKRSDNSVQAQRLKMLAMLRRQPRSTYEFRRQGVSHPAQRIKELIALGCDIKSTRVTTVDGDGFSHPRVAMYELKFEPARLCLQPHLSTPDAR
ncbi:helix-turn-helix domain-containing protein [Paraburkholderia silviterrae]|uniref:Winged helix-turn-helix domain-containing protein n=1 Tax=Paraburkholderia silviterrae TaxID=2528715 RepID=A0A4R5MB92_9BURK|nr:helix-turn-helix domain-containing protein [Paraburkholderia silviterrae]TDG24040.1 hypothetical protein EYW47_11040 [Paraburkholderia silviterrae]